MLPLGQPEAHGLCCLPAQPVPPAAVPDRKGGTGHEPSQASKGGALLAGRGGEQRYPTRIIGRSLQRGHWHHSHAQGCPGASVWPAPTGRQDGAHPGQGMWWMRGEGGDTQRARLQVPNTHCPHKQSPSPAWGRALLFPSPPGTRLTSREGWPRLTALPVGIVLFLSCPSWLGLRHSEHYTAVSWSSRWIIW